MVRMLFFIQVCSSGSELLHVRSLMFLRKSRIPNDRNFQGFCPVNYVRKSHEQSSWNFYRSYIYIKIMKKKMMIMIIVKIAKKMMMSLVVKILLLLWKPHIQLLLQKKELLFTLMINISWKLHFDISYRKKKNCHMC